MGYALFLIVNVMLASWVAKDAHARGKSGGWGVFVFFTNFVGLLIYFAVREGFQREDESIPVTLKVIAGLFILSLVLNVQLYSGLNGARRDGVSLAEDLMSKQVYTLDLLAQAIEDVLGNPDDRLAMATLATLHEQNRVLYVAKHQQRSFLDSGLIDELYTLGTMADEVVGRHILMQNVTALSEDELREIIVFNNNLRRAVREMQQWQYFAIEENVGLGDYANARKEIIDSLRKVNQSSLDLTVVQ